MRTRGSKRIASLMLAVVAVMGCDDDHPGRPSGSSNEHLAGGGRSTSDAPFAGGPENSGPSHPGFAAPAPGYLTLFYAETDCWNVPGERLITNQTDWGFWWNGAIPCLEVTTPCGPPLAPEVDFATSSIVAISLPNGSESGRGLWVTNVEDGPAGSVVTYAITHVGEDCLLTGVGPAVTSPTMAALVPGPLIEPITWIAQESTIDCSWVEDPSDPVCLYYTDAECALGASEQVVRDIEYWDAWLELAFRCDQTRWFGNDSTLIVYPEGSPARGDSGVCGDTLTIMPSAPMWLGAEVDFATHVVLILRAEEQSRWGGGVWLDSIETGPAGSTIVYTVTRPSEECPSADGEVLRPTAAIRVPLPLPEPIAWVRNDETIDCDWGGVDPSPPPKW